MIIINPLVTHQQLLPAFCGEGNPLDRISSLIALTLTSKELYEIIHRPYLSAFINQIKIKEFGVIPLGRQLNCLKSWKRNQLEQSHVAITPHASYSILRDKLISFGKEIAWAHMNSELKFNPIALPDSIKFHCRARNFVAESSKYIALNQGYDGIIYLFNSAFDFIHKWTMKGCLSQLEIHGDRLYARTSLELVIFSLNDLEALPVKISLPEEIKDAIFCFGKTHMLYWRQWGHQEVKLGYILYNGGRYESPHVMEMSFLKIFAEENDFLAISEHKSHVYVTKLTVEEEIHSHHLKCIRFTREKNHELKDVFYHLKRVFAAYETPSYEYVLYSYDLESEAKMDLEAPKQHRMANCFVAPHFIRSAATDIHFATMLLSNIPVSNEIKLSISTFRYD